MRPTGLLLSVVVTVCLVATACSSGGDSQSGASSTTEGDSSAADLSQAAGAVVANTAGTITTTGPQRVMTAIIGPTGAPFLGGPDVPVMIVFRAVESEDEVRADGRWLTTNAAALGLYVSNVEFPSAGPWAVTVLDGEVEVASTNLVVTDDSSVPKIGDKAPASDTPVGTSAEEIEAISTDFEPDPAFYSLSIAEAVSNGRPTMIAFVTPAFCQTALCGPTLEAVKAAAAGRSNLDVVHVEPFDIELATGGDFRPIPAMAEWGLQTEPWVFVVDADGFVQSSFEGIMGQAELEEALASFES